MFKVKIRWKFEREIAKNCSSFVSKDDAERMCGRCKQICLSSGTEEEKSGKRLARWKRKQAQLKLIEQHKQT
jgi:CelD/BcsL family acetyltransferase involved in cellulose biosynthesis